MQPMMHRGPPPQHPQQLQHLQQGGGLPPSAMTQQQQQQQQQHHQQQLLQQQRAQAAAAMAQQPLSLICRFGAEFTQEIVSKTLETITVMRTLTLPANINHLTNLSQNQLEEKKGEMRKQMTAIRLCFDRLRQMYERCGQIDQSMEIGEMRPTEVVMENIIPLLDEDEDSDGEDNFDDVGADEEDQLQPKSEEEKMNEDGLPAKKAKQTLETERKQRRSKGFADQRYRGPRIDDERRRKNPKIALLETEYRDLLALNQLKSRQMKEIIDRLRKLVWDINTMIAVSAST